MLQFFWGEKAEMLRYIQKGEFLLSMVSLTSFKTLFYRWKDMLLSKDSHLQSLAIAKADWTIWPTILHSDPEKHPIHCSMLLKISMDCLKVLKKTRLARKILSIFQTRLKYPTSQESQSRSGGGAKNKKQQKTQNKWGKKTQKN